MADVTSATTASGTADSTSDTADSTSGGGPICGDGVVDPGERCDTASPDNARCVDCEMVCDLDWLDCDATIDNGCEVERDLENCVACDEPCVSLEVATVGVAGPIALAADSSRLFWLDSSEGDVSTVSTAGGPAVTLIDGLIQPADLALVFPTADSDVATHVVASDAGADALHLVAGGGGEPLILMPPAPGPLGIAVDGQRIYFASTEQEAIMVTAGLIGGPFSTLSRGQPDVSEVAAAGEFVYWVAGNALRRIDAAGAGPIEELATVSSDIDSFAIVGDAIVFAEPGEGTIWSLDSTGVSAIVTGESIPKEIAADDDGVYWWNEGHAHIRRADLDGSNASVVVVETGDVRGIATDAAWIYWAAHSDDAIRKIEK